MAIKTVKRPPIKGNFGRPELLAIAIGQVIGAGVVTYTVTCIKMTGYSAWLAYFFAILIGFLIILPNLLASSAVRVNGGFYAVVSSALGPKMSGVFIYMNLVSYIGIAMFAVSCAAYLGDIFPIIGGATARMLVATGIMTLFYVINMLGMDVMAGLQKIMTWTLIAALFIFAVIGLFHIELPVFNFSDPNFFTQGMVQWKDGLIVGGFIAAIFAFVGSTYGYGNIIGYGGQSKNPRKDMPWVMIMSALVITVLYVGVSIVAAGVMSIEDYGQSTTLVFAAKKILPTPLFIAFIICGPVMALTTTLNASFSFSAITVAQSCEDGWLPKALAQKNKYGAYKWILTLLYVVSMLPVLLQFSIYTLLNQIQLLTSSVILVYLFGFFKLPERFPEAFSRIKVSKGFYKMTCIVSMIIEVIIIGKSCLSINLGIVVCSLLAFAVCIGIALWRAKAADVTVYDSVWDEKDEAAAFGET